jgi:hypothetical protein
MYACDRWFADDAFYAASYAIHEPVSGGARIARRDGRAHLLPPWCGHPAEDCPPHRSPEPQAA